MGKHRAGSFYTGLRVTLTQSEDAGHTIVSVAVKGPRDRWDEYRLLIPPIRLAGADPIRSAAEAARAIEEAVGIVLAELSG